MLTGAAVDCERILESWWGQPVNTATAFGFLLAAVVVYLRGASLPTSALIAGVGVGSIAFHGPMPTWGEFAHDLSIVWMLMWVILSEIGRRRLWPATFLVGSLLALTPVLADPSQAMLAAGTVGLILRSRRQTTLGAVALLGLGAVVGTLSRTGWPWCVPDSLWQGHGFWHLAAAASLLIWGRNENLWAGTVAVRR